MKLCTSDLVDIAKYKVIITSPLGGVQSIVMSTSVCVCVCVCVCACFCLSVLEDISGTTCAIFTKFFVHVAYGCSSVLLLPV